MHHLIDEPPTRIDVTVPHDQPRRGTRRARHFTRADVKLRGGIPVTCVARTLVDLAGVVPRERLEDVLDRALLRGLVSIPSIRRYIRSRQLAHERGVGVLQRLLDDREGGIPGSQLERAFERVLRRYCLPAPERQIEVGRYRVDFLYQRQRVWVEVNGRKDHGRKTVFEADHVRHNDIALELNGFLHLRFTWTQVTKQQRYVADAVDRALTVRR
jgi:very-short-patch-repair endonuclease